MKGKGRMKTFWVNPSGAVVSNDASIELDESTRNDFDSSSNFLSLNTSDGRLSVSSGGRLSQVPDSAAFAIEPMEQIPEDEW